MPMHRPSYLILSPCLGLQQRSSGSRRASICASSSPGELIVRIIIGQARKESSPGLACIAPSDVGCR